MEAGRDPETPVMLVRWATTPDQEVLSGTLATIAESAAAVGFKAPAIIVVGAVVALRERIAWYESGPLAGMTIAVTRARSQISALALRLRSLGACVLELPAIAIAPLPSYDEVDACIADLRSYRFVVFTSANGVKAFFERLSHAGLDSRALASARVAAIGPATAEELKGYGIAADFVPCEYRAEAVADAINDYAAYVGYKGAELKGEDVIKVMDSFLMFYKDPNNFKIELPGFRFETRSDKPTKKGKTVDEILNDWISRI